MNNLGAKNGPAQDGKGYGSLECARRGGKGAITQIGLATVGALNFLNLKRLLRGISQQLILLVSICLVESYIIETLETYTTLFSLIALIKITEVC